MNLLFLSLSFPDADNPTRGTFNQGLCVALAQKHQVQVIAPRAWHEWLRSRLRGRQFLPSSVAALSHMQIHFPVFGYLPRFLPRTSGQALWWSVRSSVKLVERTFQPDAVISYWAYPDGSAGLRAAKYFGVPSLVIVGGSDVLLLPKESGRGWGVRGVLLELSAVVAVSAGLQRATVDLGVAADRVHVIKQGVNHDIFFPKDQQAARRNLGLPQDAEILVWVGRMVPVKNLDLLLSVMRRLVPTRPTLQLYLLGDGELRSSLQTRVKEEGLSAHIHFPGAATHDVLADWYRAANATVLTSHSEGLPNVLRESLACGTPFVTTDVGSVGEIADPTYSRVVPPGNTESFAEAVNDILHPRYREAAAGYQARTWNACADEFIELIQSLQAQKSGRPAGNGLKNAQIER